MANVLSLALKINADASGLKLDPVEKALQRLGTEVEKVTSVFAPFAAETAAAAQAQEQFGTRFAELAKQLQDKLLLPKEYADQFAALKAEAAATAEVFAEGARTTAKYGDAAANTDAQLAKLEQQVKAGAITEEIYQRAIADVTGETAKAAAAEAEREKFLQRAAQLTQAVISPMERYDAAVQELNQHKQAGTISEETYNRQLAEVTATFVKAESAAQGYDQAVEGAGKGGTLAFNELSGILAAIPGPIGNIAGRFSGLASAGEGLGRVFQGGLSAGISGIATSVTALVNPFTAAVAGIAAFGAAATAVVNGLTQLDDRIEKLGNTADKLGVSFGFIQTLEEAAIRSGTSIDAVSAAFTRLQVSVTGVDEESKKAQAGLASLGVTAEDLKALSPEQQYQLISERLREIEDPAQRSATAIQLFGKSGAELLPFFNNLEGAAVDIQRFNGAISDIDRARVDGLGASFDAVRISLSGFGVELLTPFIGITQSIGDGLASVIASLGRGIGSILDTLSPVTSAIGLVVNVFAQLTSAVVNVISTALEPFAAAGRILSEAIDGISKAVTAVAGRVTDGINALREFFKFDAVASAFRDTFAGIGDAFEKVGEIAGRIATIVTTALSKLGQAVADTFGGVVTFVTDAVSAFGEFTGISGIISSFASSVSSAFSGLYDGIRNVISGVGGFIEKVLKFAEDWLGIKADIEEPVTPTVDTTGIDTAEEVSKDFQKTLDEVGQRLNKAIEESGQFGQAGFDAALQYQNALAELKDQFDRGMINENSYRAAIEDATNSYEQQIDTIKEVTAENERRAKAEQAAAQKIIDDNRKIADSLLEQQRIDREFGGDSGRAKAAENVAALEAEIARVQEEQRKANAEGRTADAEAAAKRLANLDQALAKEQDIASGAKAARDAATKAAEDAAKEQERIDKEQARRSEELANQKKQAIEEIFKAEEAYNKRIFDLESNRIKELSRLRGGAVDSGDLRDNADTFLDLLGGREDAAIAEYRNQLAELKKMREDIQKLRAGKAEILGGVG